MLFAFPGRAFLLPVHWLPIGRMLCVAAPGTAVVGVACRGGVLVADVRCIEPDAVACATYVCFLLARSACGTFNNALLQERACVFLLGLCLPVMCVVSPESQLSEVCACVLWAELVCVRVCAPSLSYTFDCSALSQQLHTLSPLNPPTTRERAEGSARDVVLCRC